MAVKGNNTTIIDKVRGVSPTSEEDDSIDLNSLVKEEYGLNLDLYQSNMENEFDDGKEKNPKLFEAFINFSNKLDRIFTGFNVISLLKN